MRLLASQPHQIGMMTYSVPVIGRWGAGEEWWSAYGGGRWRTAYNTGGSIEVRPEVLSTPQDGVVTRVAAKPRRREP